MKRNKVTIEEIARLKDILNGCGEVDMMFSGNYDAEEMACQIVLQFVDDGEVLSNLYELTSGKEFTNEVSLEEVQKSLQSFFIMLPEIYVKWIEKFLIEKHLQFQRVMSMMVQKTAESMSEKMQTVIGKSTNQLQEKVSIQKD